MMKSSQSVANDGSSTRNRNRRGVAKFRYPKQSPAGQSVGRWISGHFDETHVDLMNSSLSHSAGIGAPAATWLRSADDFISGSDALSSSTFFNTEEKSFSWNGLLAPLHQLLAPPAIPCLTCGKTISERVRGYPEICLSCYLSIPWIKKPRCQICGRSMGCPDCTRKGQAPRSFVMNRSAVTYNPMMREWLAQYKYRGNETYGTILARMTGVAYRQMVKELEEAGYMSKGKIGESSFRFHAVTAVPVSSERMQERGFNQAARLAYGAATAGRIPLLNLLERSRHTEKQSFKTRWERLHDLHDAFQLTAHAADKLLAAVNEVKSNRNSTSSWASSWFGAVSWDDSYPPRLQTMPQVAEKKLPRFQAAGLDPFSRTLTEPTPEPIRILLVDDVYTTGSTLEACSRVLHALGGQIGKRIEIYCLTWARS